MLTLTILHAAPGFYQVTGGLPPLRLPYIVGKPLPSNLRDTLPSEAQLRAELEKATVDPGDGASR